MLVAPATTVEPAVESGAVGVAIEAVPVKEVSDGGGGGGGKGA